VFDSVDHLLYPKRQSVTNRSLVYDSPALIRTYFCYGGGVPSMKRVSRIAVDIGNSGLRAIELPVSCDGALPTPLRIPWNHADRAAVHVVAEDADGGDAGRECWTSQLLPLIGQAESTQWWISSVHRPACGMLADFLSQQPNCQFTVVNHQQIPLAIEVDMPSLVGVDRLLAAFAASRASAVRPLIVIQAGSAVTVDLLEAHSESSTTAGVWGRFAGGAILPGVPMMLRLLGSAAEMLPEVEAKELVDLPPLPGRNSGAAMLAGVSSSLVGGVQHLVGRYRRQQGQEIPIVLSGGDGPLLAQHLEGPLIEVNHLVLEGLRLIADEVPAAYDLEMD
jgi:type III pantothenate kinase